jgi:chromosome partitioning protein
VIILIGAEKGGCGKSTIAVNIAATLSNLGNDVCLVDSDRQLTSSDWIEYRQDLKGVSEVHAVAKLGNITKAIKDLGKRYQFVIVDVAGRDSKELRYGMIAADILLSPLRPSQPDVNTVPKVADIFEEAKIMNPNLVGYLVMNLCPTNPVIKEADEAAKYLNTVEGFKLAKTRIHDRKAFRDAFADGFGVVEWKDPKAKKEILDLLTEIKVW